MYLLCTQLFLVHSLSFKLCRSRLNDNIVNGTLLPWKLCQAAVKPAFGSVFLSTGMRMTAADQIRHDLTPANGVQLASYICSTVASWPTSSDMLPSDSKKQSFQQQVQSMALYLLFSLDNADFAVLKPHFYVVDCALSYVLF